MLKIENARVYTGKVAFRKWLHGQRMDAVVGIRGCTTGCPYAIFIDKQLPASFDYYAEVRISFSAIKRGLPENNTIYHFKQCDIYAENPQWLQKFIKTIDLYHPGLNVSVRACLTVLR